MLELQNVTLAKEKRIILDHVDLSIKAGEIHSILGMNGTGKTTLAYAIMGLPEYHIDSGKIIWGEKDITRFSVAERAKLGITLAWQEPAHFEGLTVVEYLRLGQIGKNNPLPVDECLQQVGLEPVNYLHRDVDATLSGGERKRIELAAVLAMQPGLAILDEPDSGIDTLSITNIKQVILNLVRKGTSILLITHHEQVAAMANRTSALCAGKILKTGLPEDVTRFFRNHCQPCNHINQPEAEVLENA